MGWGFGMAGVFGGVLRIFVSHSLLGCYSIPGSSRKLLLFLKCDILSSYAGRKKQDKNDLLSVPISSSGYMQSHIICAACR